MSVGMHLFPAKEDVCPLSFPILVDLKNKCMHIKNEHNWFSLWSDSRTDVGHKRTRSGVGTVCEVTLVAFSLFCVCVCVCICVSLCVCVCVCERERKRERAMLVSRLLPELALYCVCVVCVCERESANGKSPTRRICSVRCVCVCVCVVCVCVFEFENVLINYTMKSA